MRQKWRLIASPSPVPPYLLRVDASAWENASNRRPSCSSVIPMPVSERAKTRNPPPPAPPPCEGEGRSAAGSPSLAHGGGGWGVGASFAALNAITPWSVNLAALESRLNNVCRTLV